VSIPAIHCDALKFALLRVSAARGTAPEGVHVREGDPRAARSGQVERGEQTPSHVVLHGPDGHAEKAGRLRERDGVGEVGRAARARASRSGCLPPAPGRWLPRPHAPRKEKRKARPRMLCQGWRGAALPGCRGRDTLGQRPQGPRM